MNRAGDSVVNKLDDQQNNGDFSGDRGSFQKKVKSLRYLYQLPRPLELVEESETLIRRDSFTIPSSLKFNLKICAAEKSFTDKTKIF